MSKNYRSKFMRKSVDLLRHVTEGIALVLCIILMGASAMFTVDALFGLVAGDVHKAILDALFIVILLELFYAIRSFIKRGSINAGVIVNVGIIAAVKELVFKLPNLELQLAISFGVIFLSLGVLYILEVIHYEKKRDDNSD